MGSRGEWHSLVTALAISFGLAGSVSAQVEAPRADSILLRAERGDAAARKAVEPLAWAYLKTVAISGNLPVVDARRMARAALLMEGPLPALDTPPGAAELTWRAAAVNALLMVVDGDATDAWGAAQLEQIAPYPFIWTDPAHELALLRDLAAHHATMSGALATTHVRLELEVGAAENAQLLFGALAPNALSTAARGHLGAEVAFARKNDVAGSTAYYDGAAAIADSTDINWYTRDLAWIATPSELDEWNALSNAAREPWLEKFWNRRDLNDGQLPGTRLPEQFRRWRIALRDYRWEYDGSMARGNVIPHMDGIATGRSPTDHTETPFPKDANRELQFLNRMRPLSIVIDDRGGLILRHGEPELVAVLPGIEPRFESTMRWQTPSGPLVVGFSRPQFDKVLYEKTDRSTTSMRWGMLARNYPVGDLISICPLDGRLCQLDAMVETNGPNIPAVQVFAETLRKDYQVMRDSAERTDGNADVFTRDLDPIMQAYGVPDVGTLVVFALPAKNLVPDDNALATTHHFAARVRAVVGDSARGVFAGALDTVRTWTVTDAATSEVRLTGFALVPAPPGDWAVSVVVSDLARKTGNGRRLGAVPIIALDGKTLKLGDPILGSRSSGLAWTHDGTTIPLNPRNAWAPGDIATLTYVVDGLVPAHQYDTRIEIWDAAGKPTSFRSAVTFSARAERSTETEQRDISLAELHAGDYRVVINVTDHATGATVSRERLLAVRP